MTLRTKTAKRMLLSVVLIGVGALATIGPADAKAPATRQCTPVRFEVNFQGTRVNAFSDLRATSNLSFQWHGQQWGWTVYSRADDHTATTMWTARHRQQVWSTTRLAVS